MYTTAYKLGIDEADAPVPVYFEVIIRTSAANPRIPRAADADGLVLLALCLPRAVTSIMSSSNGTTPSSSASSPASSSKMNAALGSVSSFLLPVGKCNVPASAGSTHPRVAIHSCNRDSLLRVALRVPDYDPSKARKGWGVGFDAELADIDTSATKYTRGLDKGLWRCRREIGTCVVQYSGGSSQVLELVDRPFIILR